MPQKPNSGKIKKMFEKDKKPSREELEEQKIRQERDKIVLIKQTYDEARRNGFSEELELICLINTCNSDPPCHIKGMDESLKEGARKVGATHIFGIEYKSAAGSLHGGNVAYGDAYKNKSPSQK